MVIRSHRIGGKSFLVHLEPIAGYVARPGDKPEIYIDPRLSDADAFRTAIHEAIHASLPSFTEDQVAKLEADVAGFALRLFCVSRKQSAWPK